MFMSVKYTHYNTAVTAAAATDRNHADIESFESIDFDEAPIGLHTLSDISLRTDS